MPEPRTGSGKMPPLHTAPPTEADARKQLAYFDRLVKQVRTQIENERKAGLPAIMELRNSLARSQAEVDRLSGEIAEAKAQARKRKDEIDEWQRWYDACPDEEKPAALEKLNGEVRWRAEEINAVQARIGDLDAAKLALDGAVEAVKQQISVVESGILQRPIEEDPRLVSVLAARDMAAHTLQTWTIPTERVETDTPAASVKPRAKTKPHKPAKSPTTSRKR